MNDSQNPVSARVIAYSDSDFTNPHEMVRPDEPKDCRGDFTHMGAKYWGLETARHKATTVNAHAGTLTYQHNVHNWVHIGLHQRTVVERITVSTRWFTGNQVRAISAELIDELTGQSTQVLERVTLNPDAEHDFAIEPTVATECFVKIYYEGGISRINFFGAAAENALPERPNLLEQATISHTSNDHYGNPAMAVKGNRAEMHMVGWESARTGFGERTLFTLAAPTQIEEFVVDTYLHRLNPPLTCHLFGLSASAEADLGAFVAQAPRWGLTFADGTTIIPDDFQAYMLEQRYLSESAADVTQFAISLHQTSESPWRPILPFEALRADTYHRFKQFENNGPFTHVLYMHYPNGGVHGLKLFGQGQG